MPGLFTGATGTWGGFAGLLYGSTSLSTPPGLLADVGVSFSPASLFAAGEPGVWYDPSDFSTMFQDSAGTTPVTAVEQPVGLLLDKSKGLVLGPELVTNGDFSNGTTGWSASAATLSDNAGRLQVVTISSNQGAFQSVPTTSGTRYKGVVTVVSATAAYNIGYGTGFGLGQVYDSGALTGSRTYTFYFVGNGTSATFWLYAAAAGTYLFDNVTIKELPGNHATQATSASRPVLSARVNLLLRSQTFSNAYWDKVRGSITDNDVVAPDGTTTGAKFLETTDNNTHFLGPGGAGITVSNGVAYTYSAYLKTLGRQWVSLNVFDTVNRTTYFDIVNGVVGTTAAGTTASIQNVGNGWFRCVITITVAAIAVYPAVLSASADGTNSFTGDITKGFYIWGADLRVTNDGVNLPLYQRVNTSTDYDTTGFPYYLRFDGSDDSMATNTITPGIDKAQVFAGVRKLSDAAQAVVAEMSATIASNNGTFLLAAPDDASATFAFDSKGTTQVDAIASSLTAPLTRVVTGIGDISGDTAIIRINGVQADQETSDQGTGNYLAYPLYIGRRNNATLPFNGRIYSLITRFGANLDVVTINNTEVYVSGKMGGGYVSPITGYDFLVDANGDQITDASDNPLFTQALYT